MPTITKQVKKTSRRQSQRRRALADLEAMRPRSRAELAWFLSRVLGLTVPAEPVVPGNQAPLDYMEHAFFEGGAEAGGCRLKAVGQTVPVGARRGQSAPGAYSLRPTACPPSDSLVWASRGGGKTMLGAAATALDLLYKPGVQVRILGGSLEQSGKMFAYLRRFFALDLLAPMLARDPTHRRVDLTNGSTAEVLAQSQTSVRGVHVHKLRCDEIELFDPEVWEAAQLVTRSGDCGGQPVAGRIEALSTLHLPYGLMAGLVEKAGGRDCELRIADCELKSGQGPLANARHSAGGGAPLDVPQSAIRNPQSAIPLRLFRWCALDVVERCPPARNCAGCPLGEDCAGRARRANGFVKIDDLIAQKPRLSRQAWQAEVLCQRPQTRDCVYPQFAAELHVIADVGESRIVDCGSRIGVRQESRGATGRPPLGVADQCSRAGTDPGTGLPRAADQWHPKACLQHRAASSSLQSAIRNPQSEILIAGMDFGVRSPLAMLWAVVQKQASKPARDWVVTVVDEYARGELTLDRHLAAIEARGWPRPAWIGVDPAGLATNGHSGLSDVQVLRQRGHKVRTRPGPVADGIERLRRRLDQHTLLIHSRCTQLIQAISTYHFDPRRRQDPKPIKDGPDHLCDALRYMIVNLEAGSGPAQVGMYW